MAGFPFDVVVFDLDGTLVDSAPDLAASLNHTLARLGRPGVDPEAVRYLVGHGARALLRKGLAASGEAPETLVERGYPIYLEHYAANLCVGTRAYPGIEDALDALAARGAALAVCTNKPERLTHELLDALGWRGRFAAVIGADTVGAKKPDPRPLKEAIARACPERSRGAGGAARAVLVGDSITDADTARAAGVPFVAVSFGYSDRPVEALGAGAVIGGYGGLIRALSRFWFRLFRLHHV